MIKLTLAEAFANSQALSQLPRINAKASYDLARMQNAIRSALKPVGEQQRALVSEYGGTINDDGSFTWPKPEKDQTPADALYRKAWAELLEHETDIDREPIKLSAILGPDPAKYPEIQPELLSILEKIIVE